MLDFYLIAPEDAKPVYPEQAGLVLAGDLDDETFDKLKRKQVIDERFEYYTDFRWSREVIMQMRSTIIKRHLQSDTDIQKLLKLLDLADQNNSSLLVYAD